MICDNCKFKWSYTTGSKERPPHTTLVYCAKGYWVDKPTEHENTPLTQDGCSGFKPKRGNEMKIEWQKVADTEFINVWVFGYNDFITLEIIKHISDNGYRFAAYVKGEMAYEIDSCASFEIASNAACDFITPKKRVIT